jgi:hypothetical protein
MSAWLARENRSREGLTILPSAVEVGRRNALRLLRPTRCPLSSDAVHYVVEDQPDAVANLIERNGERLVNAILAQ